MPYETFVLLIVVVSVGLDSDWIIFEAVRPRVALPPAVRYFEKHICLKALRPGVALPPAARHFGK